MLFLNINRYLSYCYEKLIYVLKVQFTFVCKNVVKVPFSIVYGHIDHISY